MVKTANRQECKEHAHLVPISRQGWRAAKYMLGPFFSQQRNNNHCCNSNHCKIFWSIEQFFRETGTLQKNTWRHTLETSPYIKDLSELRYTLTAWLRNFKRDIFSWLIAPKALLAFSSGMKILFRETSFYPVLSYSKTTTNLTNIRWTHF